MTGGNRIDGLEHTVVIGKLNRVGRSTRRVRKRHAVGASTLNAHAIRDGVAIGDGVHDPATACATKIHEFHGPAVIVGVVVVHRAVLGLDGGGLTCLGGECEHRNGLKGGAGAVQGLEGVVDLVLRGGLVAKHALRGGEGSLEGGPGVGGVIVLVQGGGVIDGLLQVGLIDGSLGERDIELVQARGVGVAGRADRKGGGAGLLGDEVKRHGLELVRVRMTGGNRIDGLEHTVVIGKLNRVGRSTRRVRKRHAVGASTLNAHAIRDGVAIGDGVHDPATACATKIHEFHGPAVIVGVVVVHRAVLGLNCHGLALRSREGKRQVIHGSLKRLHGLAHLSALDIAVVGSVTGSLDGSIQLGNRVSIKVGRIQSLGARDERVARSIKIGNGDVGHTVIANDSALASLNGKGNRELLVAIGGRAGHNTTGLDIDLLLGLAVCEGNLLRRGIEVVLDSRARLGLNDQRYGTLGATGTTNGEGVGAVLVHSDVGLGEIEHTGAAVIQVGGSVNTDGTRCRNHDVVLTSLKRVGLKEQCRDGANRIVRVDGLGCAAVNGDGKRAVVGILGTHDGKLGTRELERSRSARLRGPHARALKATVDLLIVPVAGLGHLGVIDTDHALGQRSRLLKTAGCLEQAHLGNLREAQVLITKIMGRERDLNSRGSHCGTADQALGANRAAATKVGPGAVLLSLVGHREARDALAVLDGLLDGDDIERRGLGQLDGERLIGSILSTPIRIVLAVQNLGCAISLVVVPCAASLCRSGSATALVGARQVVLKRILDVLTKLANTVGDSGVELTLVVGRHVQQQRSAVADGLEVHIAQIGKRLGGVLSRAPEPTGGDAGVGLGDEPLVAIGEALAVATAQVSVEAVVRAGIGLARTPGGIVRKAVLVANPTDTGKVAALENLAVFALELIDGVVPTLEVVDLSVSARTLGAVHPDLNELAVVAVLGVTQDLPKLTIVVEVVVDLGIGRGTDTRILAIGIAVRGIVDIPGRQVQTHIQVIFSAGSRKLSEDIALTALVLGHAAHIVLGQIGLPDAEAVMMLSGNDKPRKARVLDGLDVILGVKILRERKDLARSLVAVVLAPLNLIKRVGAKMTERSKLVLLILILRAVGPHGILLRCVSGKRGRRGHSKRACCRKKQRSRQDCLGSHPPQ